MGWLEIVGTGGAAAGLTALGSVAKEALAQHRANRESAAKAALDARVVEVKARQDGEVAQNSHEEALLNTLVGLARDTATQAVAQAEKLSTVIVTASTAINGLQAAIANLQLDVRAIGSKIDALENRLDAADRASGVISREKVS